MYRLQEQLDDLLASLIAPSAPPNVCAIESCDAANVQEESGKYDRRHDGMPEILSSLSSIEPVVPSTNSAIMFS